MALRREAHAQIAPLAYALHFQVYQLAGQ